VDAASTAADVAGARSEVANWATPDPVVAELEAVLDLRLRGADARELRRALRRIEELLDDA
jgi:hypothetical protein